MKNKPNRSPVFYTVPPGHQMYIMGRDVRIPLNRAARRLQMSLNRKGKD